MAKAQKNTVKNRAKDPQGEGSQEPFRGPYSLPRGHDHRLALASGWVDSLDGLLDDGGRLLRRPRVCEIRDAEVIIGMFSKEIIGHLLEQSRGLNDQSTHSSRRCRRG